MVFNSEIKVKKLCNDEEVRLNFFSMAAVGLAITGGGALSKFETTPLLTVEETLDALRLAQKVGYRQPGQ